jgi:hypothetical protein
MNPKIALIIAAIRKVVILSWASLNPLQSINQIVEKPFASQILPAQFCVLSSVQKPEFLVSDVAKGKHLNWQDGNHSVDFGVSLFVLL